MTRRTRRAGALHVRHSIAGTLSCIFAMLPHPPLHWSELLHIAERVRPVVALVYRLIKICHEIFEVAELVDDGFIGGHEAG